VELAGLLVLVVDMAVQMGFRAKLHSATRMGALMRPVMVALVMTARALATVQYEV
jgi:hypothetical protein